MVLLEIFVVSSLYSAKNVANYILDGRKMRQELEVARVHHNQKADVKEKKEEKEKNEEEVEEVETVEDDLTLEKLFAPTPSSPTSHIKKLIEFSVPKKDTVIEDGTQTSNKDNYQPYSYTTKMATILTAAIAQNQKDNLYYWDITDFNNTTSIPYNRIWLNTNEMLELYCKKNTIPTYISGFSLPVQVREINVSTLSPYVYRLPTAKVLGTNMEHVIYKAIAPRTIGNQVFVWTTVTAVLAGTSLLIRWRNSKDYRGPCYRFKTFIRDSIGFY